jgi:cobyrinic acid a,c-diamide synthase
MGAELVFWSPLQHEDLPEQVQGLYFGGGFPEVFAAELSANQSAQQAVRQAIQSGIPTYAECGGLMYLCQQIVDFSGQSHAMAGILPTTAQMSARLTLGYRQATVLQDSPLLPLHSTVIGHEFHRSELTEACPTPLYQTTRYQSQSCPFEGQFEGWRSYQLHASYLHLHWGASPEIPQRFIQHCRAWGVKYADRN